MHRRIPSIIGVIDRDVIWGTTQRMIKNRNEKSAPEKPNHFGLIIGVLIDIIFIWGFHVNPNIMRMLVIMRDAIYNMKFG